MEKQHYCPICQTQMERSTKPRPAGLHFVSTPNHTDTTEYWTDYRCKFGIDHSYAIRFFNEELVKVKVRLQEGNDRLFFLLDYKENKIEIWTQPGQTNRIEVPGLFEPDFTNIDKLKEKLKTYMIFA